jgi:hypothetical protein
MSKRTLLILPLALAPACAENITTPAPRDLSPLSSAASVRKSTAESIASLMVEMNAKAKARGDAFRVGKAEYVTLDGSGELGAEILQKDVGNKRLTEDFVAFDPRRAAWSGSGPSASDDITFAVDETGDATPPLGITSGADANAAIRRSMDTWRAIGCAPGIGLTERSSGGQDLGFLAFLVSRRKVSSAFIAADVMHNGWRDLDFAGGVLGVTFTFVFIDAAGNATDIDGNGKDDVAFREIYYDPSWDWRIVQNIQIPRVDPNVSRIEIESVALHEAGHGLSQAHFGNIFLRNDGSFDPSPRAVMNAFYSAPLTTLLGTDESGHCGNWQSWPNK